MKLWHCVGARSLRAVWALEELGLDYELQVMQFPPRVFQRDYLDVNVLGTIPFLQDGDLTMTESCAIPHYLATRPGCEHLAVPADHPQYGDLLNWCYHADATLTFPQTLVLRYTVLEPSEEKKAVADDYAKWFIARLRRLDAHLESNDYLVDGRFTIADICVGYALYFARQLKLDERFKPQTRDYLERLISREPFKRADARGREETDAS